MSDFKIISADEAKKLIETKNVTIVDIRDPQAYEESHINDAIPLDNNALEDFVKNTEKNTTILCYCYLGFSSQEASNYLSSQGFTNIFNLEGGFEGWKENFPVT